MDKKIAKEADEKMEEWKVLLESSGNPHPSSKEFLRLTRQFFFQIGYERGHRDGIELMRSLK